MANSHYLEALQQIMREKRTDKLSYEDLSDNEIQFLEDADLKDSEAEIQKPQTLLPSSGPVKFRYTGEKRTTEEVESPYSVKRNK